MADKVLVDINALEEKKKSMESIANELESIARTSSPLHSIALGPNSAGGGYIPSNGPCRAMIARMVTDLGKVAGEMAVCIRETVNYIGVAQEDIVRAGS